MAERYRQQVFLGSAADPNGKMWNRLRASIGKHTEAAVGIVSNTLDEVIKCQ